MAGRGFFLAPSKAYIWGPGGCPAYPKMMAGVPKAPPSPAAQEGSAAHWWVDEAIHGRFHPPGTMTPHHSPVTVEMTETGITFVEDAMKTIASGARWVSEAALEMPSVHPTLNKGRLDFGAFLDGALHLREFKFGHRSVSAFENWQMIDYAIGLIDYMKLDLGLHIRVIDLRVYQPRAFTAEGPVKRWVISPDELANYASRLKQAAAATCDENPPMHTGPHCRDCDARHTCPALRAVGGLAIDMSLEGPVEALSASQAGARLRTIRLAIERLEAMETGLAAQVEAAVRSGDVTTGFEIRTAQGKTVWKVPAPEMIAVGKLFGVDVAKPLDVITPAQAEKKGLDGTVISHYTTSQAGGSKLVPIDTNAVKKAFS